MRSPGLTAPLPEDFFARDPDKVALDLLGCIIVSVAGGATTAGKVVETEAYLGPEDPGSHAATRAPTPRNSVMYGAPGTVYVYLSYGNHHMLNLVCGREGTAGAVLIRAVEPLMGLDVMKQRRGDRPVAELANGPGKLAQAMGIDLGMNGTRLGTGPLSVYAGGRSAEFEVTVGGRVGLTRGHELELRYQIVGSPYVSRGRPGPRRTNREKESL